jgi:hypothetical protein
LFLPLRWALADAAAALAPSEPDDDEGAALAVAVPVEGGAGRGLALAAGAALGTTSAPTADVDALGSGRLDGAADALGERQPAGRRAVIHGPSCPRK